MQRESKHWFSRIWLILSNIVFLLIGLVVLGAGIAAYRTVTDGEFEGVATVSKGVVLGVAIVGGFFVITAISGCIGAVGRINPLLSFYVFALIIDLIGFLAFGIFFIKTVRDNYNSWMNGDKSDWTDLDDASKDFVQYRGNCCGYTDNSLVYQGPPLVYTSERTSNACADSTYSAAVGGCFAVVTNGLNAMFKYSIVGTVVISVLILLTIGAADQARRRFVNDPARVTVVTAAPYQRL
ncbi:Tetraspanin/Peripherin [Zopfochytrium polystomum]|nr:Tetraspanin/Peripherin [Zopfochytrium polystomum]